MTTRRQQPEEEDDDPRDLEEREEYRAAYENSDADETSQAEAGRSGFVQRIGLTPLLAAAAAVIATAAALMNAFNSRSGQAPDAPPPAALSANFNVSDYWYGTPANTSQPLIFHILIAESVATPGAPSRPGTVMGTMRNPCQGQAVIRISSGSWDGTRLQLNVTQTGSGKPLSLDVHREGDTLDGTIVQDSYDGRITLQRGETSCPGR